MSDNRKAEKLIGTLQQLLFSPKGGIEGLLLEVGSKTVQVAMERDAVDANVLAHEVGNDIEVTATADRSPKTKEGAHPVYKLGAIIKVAGKPAKFNAAAAPIRGVVASIHYARHGEPNGVILESGEFIHTRPPAMKELKLKVGSTVVAHGERRMTVLGTPLLEARKVNRLTIE